MIFGKLDIGQKTLTTHNDTYVLSGISVISTRRPFLSAGLMISALSALFIVSFSNILFVGEIITLTGLSAISLWVGICIGQLRLISRDLAGSPVADAVYGTYRHLNRCRPVIADAIDRAKTGGAS